MDATFEYNLGEAKARLERCERGFQELQGAAHRYLNDLALLRQQLHTMSVQMGVEAPPAPAASAEKTPEPSKASPASVTTEPSPASRGRSGSSRSGDGA